MKVSVTTVFSYWAMWDIHDDILELCEFFNKYFRSLDHFSRQTDKYTLSTVIM